MNIENINFDEEKPILKTETQKFLFDKVIIAVAENPTKKYFEKLRGRNSLLKLEYFSDSF